MIPKPLQFLLLVPLAFGGTLIGLRVRRHFQF